MKIYFFKNGPYAHESHPYLIDMDIIHIPIPPQIKYNDITRKYSVKGKMLMFLSSIETGKWVKYSIPFSKIYQYSHPSNDHVIMAWDNNMNGIPISHLLSFLTKIQDYPYEKNIYRKRQTMNEIISLFLPMNKKFIKSLEKILPIPHNTDTSKSWNVTSPSIYRDDISNFFTHSS